MAQFTAFSGVSRVWVSTPNGHATDGDKVNIRRLTVVEDTLGDGITHATSAGAGSTFTINRPGIAVVERGDTNTAGAVSFALSINSNQLSTNQASITAAHRMASSYSALAGSNNAIITVFREVAAGDVIRGHDNTTKPNSTSADSYMCVTLYEF